MSELVGGYHLTNRADLGWRQLLWRCLRAGVSIIEATFVSDPGMESSVCQSDDSQNRSESEMDTCLFDRSQHSPFGQSNARYREVRHLHDRDDQSQKGVESAAASPKLNHFPLQISDVHVKDIKCDDI